MIGESLEEISPLLPADFFTFSLPLNHVEKRDRHLGRHFLLPDFSEILFEESFAKVFAGWHEEGLRFDVEVSQPFQNAIFPNFLQGDAFELFLDTRDLKSAGFPTRFCHHFLFFPGPVEGIQAQEITHFRTEDAHPLCDSEELSITAEISRRGYELHIFIPSSCLHGYDPSSFKRLGLNYRLSRVGGQPQHFNLSSRYFDVEEHPSLWSSFSL